MPKVTTSDINHLLDRFSSTEIEISYYQTQLERYKDEIVQDLMKIQTDAELTHAVIEPLVERLSAMDSLPSLGISEILVNELKRRGIKKEGSSFAVQWIYEAYNAKLGQSLSH